MKPINRRVKSKNKIYKTSINTLNDSFSNYRNKTERLVHNYKELYLTDTDTDIVDCCNCIKIWCSANVETTVALPHIVFTERWECCSILVVVVNWLAFVWRSDIWQIHIVTNIRTKHPTNVRRRNSCHIAEPIHGLARPKGKVVRSLCGTGEILTLFDPTHVVITQIWKTNIRRPIKKHLIYSFIHSFWIFI